MKFIGITLENFQGIRELTMEFPGGCSGSVFGDNATGKTTLFNAYTWLLFDKASTGAKNFSPKTRDGNGELHHLSHAVTGTFRTENGQEIVLRKVYHEIYKKKRGAAREEFDGHTIDYFVDGVPVKEKEYTARVLSFCGDDIEKLKILSMPDYFPEALPWDKRREILLDVCGNISDEDVIAATPELSEIRQYLNGHTIDEYRKIAQIQRKDINDQLKGIPQRIDEAQKAIPEEAYDAEATDAEIAALEHQIDELSDKKTAVPNADTTDLQRRLAKVQTQIAEGRAEYLKRQAMDKLKLSAEMEKRDALVGKRDSLLQELSEAQAMEWCQESEMCPTCGQKLPRERIAQMREDFNRKREERIGSIRNRGKNEANRDMIHEAEDRIKQLQISMVASDTPYEETPKCRELAAQESYLMGLIAKRTPTEDFSELDAEIRDKREKLHAAQDRRSAARVADVQRKRIAELEAREKELTAAFEDTEKGLYLCDVFTRQKVSMLDDRINGKFRHVRFRLFTDQINGGVKEGCDVLVPADDGRLVPFAYANNAARINAGLEIIETLAASWGIRMPVFIDNAEAVTRLLETDLQTIRLVVSEPDKSLRLVCE